MLVILPTDEDWVDSYKRRPQLGLYESSRFKNPRYNPIILKCIGEDNIDTKTAEVIPVNWPTDWSTNSQQIPKEISKILGTSDATRIRTDRKTALKLSKGLNNLVWNFQEHPQTMLFSDRDP